MNDIVFDSYYELIFKKLLTEDYVCVKDIIDQLVKSQLIPKLQNTRGQALEFYRLLSVKSNKVEDMLNVNLEVMSDNERLAVLYSNLRSVKTSEGKGVNNSSYSNKLRYIRSVFNNNSQRFLDYHEKKQRKLYNNIELRVKDKHSSMIRLKEDKKLTDYFYFEDKVKIEKITSLSECQRYVAEINNTELESGNGFFYRAHSKVNYTLVSSIARNASHLNNESNICEEILIRNPKEFALKDTHLDMLKKMQHYGIPTRLLDVSQNILISLFFSVEQDEDFDGEIVIFKTDRIKYTRSDNVAILCSMPFCSLNIKTKILDYANDPIYKNNIEEFNKKPEVRQLLHEISAEKTFSPEMDPSTFKKIFFVLPTLDNDRIVRQSGAFIVSALNPMGENINDFRVLRGGKKVIYVIPKTSKKTIKKELDLFGINRAYVYPEISEVSKYIIEKYNAK